jgi:hypothetical protein
MFRLTGTDAANLMEAYNAVYAPQQEEEVISEDLQQKVGQALDAAAKNPVIKAIGSVIAPVGKGRGTVTKAEQEKRIQQNQSVDLFDLVKGHLIGEGYADTEEAALVIMANMSEDWKKSIIEQSNTLVTPEQRRADELKYGMKRTTPLPPARSQPAGNKKGSLDQECLCNHKYLKRICR